MSVDPAALFSNPNGQTKTTHTIEGTNFYPVPAFAKKDVILDISEECTECAGFDMISPCILLSCKKDLMIKRVQSP